VATRAPAATRRKILEAAFAEFHLHGFQGGSVNRIVDAAKITKGALFHHFDGKQGLGCAVVDEIIGPLLEQRWLEALRHTYDPIPELQRAFRQHIRTDVDCGSSAQGCPLNNLAQEMSPLDEGFQRRIDALYCEWRKVIAEALEAGMQAGTVKRDVSPTDVAALIVSAQMGIWGTGKSSQSGDLMVQAGEAVCHYLESLRA